MKVINTQCTDLSEQIYVGLSAGGDGELWFWWSWAEPMTPAAEVDSATNKITKVLGWRPRTAASRHEPDMRPSYRRSSIPGDIA